MIMPCVVKETASGIIRTTVEDEQFSRREIEICDSITRDVAMNVIRQLRYLANENDDDITLYISSNGGSVIDGLAIYDTMQIIGCDIVCIGVGEISSMATVLLAGGTHGKRYVYPNAKVMIHDPIVPEASGSALTVDSLAKRLMDTRRPLAEILADHTGRHVSEILENTVKDTFFTAKEAVEFGIADHVIKKHGGLKNVA